MKLEILMSCMHQNDAGLAEASGLSGDVVMINQCQEERYTRYPTKNGTAHLYCTRERGLTRSRNMAIEKASGDICMLCDDDEQFVEDYEAKILQAYQRLPQADIIVFKMRNRRPSFPDRVRRLRFPLTLRVSSWQISFRRQSLLRTNVRFDTRLGAGTGNGGEEELKFLLDCEKAGLNIFYVPTEIASVSQTDSTWFHGFTETFFENRGSTTRYILGWPIASLYAVYYLLFKYKLYSETISLAGAARAIFRGIRKNEIAKQADRVSEEARAGHN